MMIHVKEFNKQAYKVNSQSKLNSRAENTKVQPKSEISSQKMTRVKKEKHSNVQVSKDALQMD